MKNKEGNFYASKVHLFLNEDGGEDLQEFCKAENVSYSKMCHCLGRPSYRKPKATLKPSTGDESQVSDAVLPVIDLQPLVVDVPNQSAEPSSPAPAPQSGKKHQKKETSKCATLSDVVLTLFGRFDVRIGSCEVKTLVTLIKEMEVTL